MLCGPQRYWVSHVVRSGDGTTLVPIYVFDAVVVVASRRRVLYLYEKLLSTLLKVMLGRFFGVSRSLPYLPMDQ